MLKNLDPLLNADVLHALCAMGHGDEVVICDANFPADSVSPWLRPSWAGGLVPRCLPVSGRCFRSRPLGCRPP